MKKLSYISLSIIVFLGILIYGLTLRGRIGNFDNPADYTPALQEATSPFESSHERAPYMQMVSIVRNHSFSIDSFQADFASPDVGYFHGRFYSFFPPGVSLIAAPFFILGQSYNLGQVFSYAFVGILSVFSLLIVYILGRRVLNLSVASALFSSLTFGFATVYLSYASTMYQHALTTFIILCTFYAAWRYNQGGELSWIWACCAWILYGFSVFVDYPNLILVLPPILYLLVSAFNFSVDIKKYKIYFRTSIVATSIFLVCAAGMLLYYNKTQFDNPFELSNRLPRYVITNLNELQLDDKAAIEKNNDTGTVFKEQNIVNGLYELTIAPDKGLFFFSPILILGILGIYVSRKKFNFALWALLGIVILDFFVYASTSDPYGGWAFGPRYMVPAIPVFALFAGVWLDSLKKYTLPKIIAFALFIYSAAIALIGATTTAVIPPEVEADYYHLKYGISAAYDYFKANSTGSFVYNQYLYQFMKFHTFAGILFGLVVLAGGLCLFIIPHYSHEF